MNIKRVESSERTSITFYYLLRKCGFRIKKMLTWS